MSYNSLYRTVTTMTNNQILTYGIAAAGAVWFLGKVVRAIAHYLFPSAIPGEPNTSLLATPHPNTSTPLTAADLSTATEYDYIIIGTGTAGCVLANRLSTNPNIPVLAIESGHSDLKQLFSRIPAGFARLFRTAADHDIKTTPQSNAGNRSMQWPRGKMLGGCSAINAMIYNRAPPSDWDEWEAKGNKGWSFKDVEPYMLKAECFTANATHHLPAEDLEQHGTDGPWQTGYSYQSGFTPKFLSGCESNGIPIVPDVNTRKGINGVTRLQTFIDKKGQRSSAAVAYLTADVVSRSNLKIATGQTVTRIIFDTESDPAHPRAIGVEMAASATSPLRYVARARREVILSAGSVHTPHLLLLSGVGPAKDLSQHSIPVIKDLPAVGANLVDHIFSNVVFKILKGMSLEYLADPIISLPALVEWLRFGTGALTSNVAEAAAFLRTAEREDAPASLRNNDLSTGPTSSDLEILMGAAVYRDHGATAEKKGDFASIGPIMLRPSSRGSITLSAPSVFTPPLVNANYLSTSHDMALMLYGLKLSIKIAKDTGCFKGWNWPTAANPSIKNSSGVDVAEDVEHMTDAQLTQHIRDTCETIYHPMCTARMGTSAASSVVDPTLKVHGIQGLRVVDASVFAEPLACHPCGPVIMVGERAADLILRDQVKR